tara:strand:- start:925 stop:1488 length:564 start_codon:yes stop_codon:yes gene_type:complete
MSDKNLRDKLIRLAHKNPELRKDLLPLLSEKKANDGFFPEVFADFVMEVGDPYYGDDFYTWFAFIMKIEGVDFSEKDIPKIKSAIAKLIKGKYNYYPFAIRIEPTISQYGQRHNLHIYQNNRLDDSLDEGRVFSEYKKKVALIQKYIEKLFNGKLGSPKIKTHSGDAFAIAKKNGWTDSNMQQNTIR